MLGSFASTGLANGNNHQWQQQQHAARQALQKQRQEEARQRRQQQGQGHQPPHAHTGGGAHGTQGAHSQASSHAHGQQLHAQQQALSHAQQERVRQIRHHLQQSRQAHAQGGGHAAATSSNSSSNSNSNSNSHSSSSSNHSQQHSSSSGSGSVLTVPPPSAPIANSASAGSPAGQTAPAQEVTVLQLVPPASPLSTAQASVLDPTVSRLGGPKSPAQDPGVAVKVPLAKAGGRTPSFSSLAVLPPGSFVPHTILGDQISDTVLQELKTTYQIQSLAAPGVVRIPLGDGDAKAVLRKLKERYPDESFGLDYVYWHKPYNLALDAVAPKDSRPAGQTVGCEGDGCYGRNWIDWGPKLAACAEGLGVGIIDTGYDVKHPAFEGRKIQLIVLADGDKDTIKVFDWHGTSVLSLLAGSPTSSTPGLIPDAAFTIIDVFSSNSAGRAETTTARLLVALWLLGTKNDKVKVKPKVINMSFVGPQDNLLHARLMYVAAQGTVLVAAAGNGGPAAPRGYPAAYTDEVIAVTAVDRSGLSYDSASHGDYIDVAAPGVDIRTAQPGRREGMVTGTSFAAPFVTAIAAVTYRDSPLNSGLWAKRASRTPKQTMLDQFRIEPIGGVRLKDRDVVYGLGMIRAPKECGPKTNLWLTTTRSGPNVPDPSMPKGETLGGVVWPAARVHPASAGAGG